MGWASRDDIERWFTYQSPDRTDFPKFAAIRIAAKSLALVILVETPPSADQSAALRQLRECVATAIAAVVCRKRLPTLDPQAGNAVPAEPNPKPIPEVDYRPMLNAWLGADGRSDLVDGRGCELAFSIWVANY